MIGQHLQCSATSRIERMGAGWRITVLIESNAHPLNEVKDAGVWLISEAAARVLANEIAREEIAAWSYAMKACLDNFAQRSAQLQGEQQ